jgi:hypothetical protein
MFAGLIPHTPKTYASWPTTKEVRFEPLPKKAAVKLWHQARAFERQTRQPGHQDGAIGRNGLAVLHSLLFDFLNYASGALYPSGEAIAEKAAISPASAWRGIANLKAAGILHRVRRCVEDRTEDGRFFLRQLTNAYHVLGIANWIGFKPAPEAPPPQSGTWGDHPPMPSPLEQASILAGSGGTVTARLAALEADPGDRLAQSLARLGRLVHGPKP